MEAIWATKEGKAVTECCIWREIKWEYRKWKSEKAPGFIVNSLRFLFFVVYLISPTKWISGKLSDREKIDRGNYHPYCCVEIYVICWLFIEMALVIYIFKAPMQVSLINNQLVINIFRIAFIIRLIDIFQSWVSQFVLKSKWEAIHITRSLILAIINYIEIAIIAAFLRFVLYPNMTLCDAFGHSVMTMIANPQIGEDGLLIMYVQIMFALLFLIAVAQHLVGRLSSK